MITRPKPEGATAIFNVDQNPDDPIFDQITDAYRIVLNRRPDPESLDNYASELRSKRMGILDVVQDLLRFPQRAMLEQDATLHTSKALLAEEQRQSFTAAVRNLYLTILRREPDEHGLLNQVGRLVRGEAQLTDIVSEFLASNEFAHVFTTHNNVAHQIVDTLVRDFAVIGVSDDQAKGYIDALTTGVPLSAVVCDLQKLLHTNDRSKYQRPSELVGKIYHVILGRQVNEEGLRDYTRRLNDEAMDISDLIGELLASDEFAIKFPLRINVARHLAEALIAGLTGRNPGPEAVNAYAIALSNGYRLEEFIDELKKSPESYWSAGTLQATPIAKASAEAVESLYKIILGRSADEGGLTNHVARLGKGEINLTDLVEEFITSDEFGNRFSQLENVARKLVEVLLVGLTGRDPGPTAINSYANAMSSGYSLSDFVEELKRSPEFAAPPSQAVSTANHVPTELAVLAQEVIGALMRDEGSSTGLPPMNTLGATPTTSIQFASLIRTLGMLASTRTQ